MPRTINTNPSASITDYTPGNITYSCITSTGRVQYQELNQSSDLVSSYKFKPLSNYTKDKNLDKYHFCVSSGDFERNFILRTMLLNNPKMHSFLISDNNSFIDSFDCVILSTGGTKFNIEVKLRSFESKRYQKFGDVISKQKYTELINDSRTLKSVPLYCMLFTDNILRVYNISKIHLLDSDFILKSIPDYPGSRVYKKELQANLQTKLATTIIINE